MALLSVPDYAKPEPPQVIRGDEGLIVIKFGSSTVFGDEQHLWELMMLIKKVLAEASNEGTP